jgi:fructose-bisphosphate aldolase class II
MSLIPLRPILEATQKYGNAQGAFNVNAVRRLRQSSRCTRCSAPPAILQGADLANAFMGGRVDFCRRHHGG